MSQKEFLKKGAFGGLGRRVLFVSLLFLPLPLLVYLSFFTWKEYSLFITQAEEMLQMVGQGERAFLEEKIEMNWKVLEAFHAQKPHSFDVLEIPLPEGEQGKFLWASMPHQALWVCLQNSSTSALALPIPYASILEQFAHFEKAPFDLFLGLLDQQGNLLMGEEASGEGVGVLLELFDSDLFLLFSTPFPEIRSLFEKQIFDRFIVLLFSMLILGGGIVWLVTKRLSLPFKQLLFLLQEIKEGALHFRYRPDWLGFEINDLGIQFNQTLDSLAEHQEALAEEKVRRARLQEEFRIGKEIQEGFLPKQIDSFDSLQVKVASHSSLEVGGDFCDIFSCSDGRVIFFIGDASGKGIGACLYALSLRSTLRAFASEGLSLEEILLKANQRLCEDAKESGMFATLWMGLFDPLSKKIVYASLGHPPVLLVRKGKIERLDTEGMALGVQIQDAIATKSKTLVSTDLLFLYTDGIIEAKDGKGGWFGSQRLETFLLDHSFENLSEMGDRLMEEIVEMAQGPLHDDATIISIRVD